MRLKNKIMPSKANALGQPKTAPLVPRYAAIGYW